jgi:hypothetical protein
MFAFQGESGCRVIEFGLRHAVKIISRVAGRTRLLESPFVRIEVTRIARGKCHVRVLNRLAVTERSVVAAAALDGLVFSAQWIPALIVRELRGRFPTIRCMTR